MNSNKFIQIYPLVLNCLFGFILILSIVVNISATFASQASNTVYLTDHEKAWLKAHPIIRLAPDPEFQPIEFFDKNGNYEGIGADYARLISQKLGFQFQIVRCKNWDDVIARTKRHEVDVLNAVVKTPQRERYLLFPPPYLKIPSVIIVRKNVSGQLTLDMLKGMHVVMVSGYGYVDLIRNRHPLIQIELVPDLKTALRKVSFGMADAFVGDLATASYYIESESISNLRLAGETEPPNISGFAVRSDWPELPGIIEKGIDQLTEEERQTIFKKWIHLQSEPGMTMQEFWYLMLIFAGVISIIIIGFIFWNRTLKRMVHVRTQDLYKEIEDRKQAEKALRESEERFQAAFDSAQDCILIWDQDYNYLYANQAAIDHVGTTADKVIGKNIKNGLGHIPEFMRLWMSRVDKVFATGKRLRVQDEQKMQGRIYYTDSILSPIRDLDGNVLSVCVVYRDVTELKRTEEALRVEKEFTETALNSQQDTFFLFEPGTGKAIRWNQAFTDISGYSDEQIAEMKAPDSYYSLKDMEKARLFIDEIVKSGHGKIELDLICKQGQKIPFEYNVSVISDAASSSKYIISIGRDITERKQAEADKQKLEEQLRQAAKVETIGTLAGGIAHDFNNILGIIIGNTELAMLNFPQWHPSRTNLEEIKSASMRARDVVRQLLSFTRKTEQEKKPIKLHALIKETIQLLRASIPSSIEFQLDLPPDLGTIMADPTQIHQVIINICTNAAHAMEENGGILKIGLNRIELNTEFTTAHLLDRSGPYLQMTFTDNGTGIDPNIKDRIFDPYFTTKDIDKGTGIGLSVVFGIVKNHDGAIFVDSELGKGTTLKVLFPLIDKTPVWETITPKGPPIGNEAVMFVDDEISIAKLGQKILTTLGYQVDIKSSPLDALTSIRDNPDRFDLIITDMTMPQMTGDKLTTEILKIRPDMPIILCTGFSEKIDKQAAEKIGIRKYIEKPLDMRELAVAVREALD